MRYLLFLSILFSFACGDAAESKTESKTATVETKQALEKPKSKVAPAKDKVSSDVVF